MKRPIRRVRKLTEFPRRFIFPIFLIFFLALPIFSFANTELDFTFHGIFADSGRADFEGNSELLDISQGNGFGSEVNASFFIFEPNVKAFSFDVGISVFGGFDIFTNLEFEGTEDVFSKKGLGESFTLGLGFPLRLPLNPSLCVFFQIGGFASLRSFEPDEITLPVGDSSSDGDWDFTEILFGLDLDLGVRWWFFWRDDFNLGLCTGAKFRSGVGDGTLSLGKRDYDYEYDSKYSIGVYLGLCINLGKSF